jgi:hypothetical protein
MPAFEDLIAHSVRLIAENQLIAFEFVVILAEAAVLVL